MDTTENSNHELCKRLWLENEPKLRKLCTYKLSSHLSEVEDVLADAALIFWQTILEGKTIEYPASWLCKVTKNLINKKYRELNIEKDRKIPFDEENLKLYKLSVGYDFDSRLLTDGVIEKAYEEIEKLLAAEEKQLYKYVYHDGLKMKEIAVIMSSTESAVKQRNYRLTRKVKRLVKEFLENY